MKIRLIKYATCIFAVTAFYTYVFNLGVQYAKHKVMKQAVVQYKLRINEDEKAAQLFGVNLCVANGGVREQCIIDVRGLEESTDTE